MDVVLAVYMVIVFFAEIFIDFIFATESDIHDPWGQMFTPSWFREYSYMNKFGCWASAVIAFVCMPFGGVYRVIYWLFHI